MGLAPAQFEETLARHRDFVGETFRNAFRLAGIGETSEEAPVSRGSGSNSPRMGRPRDATGADELTVQMALFEEQADELSARVEAFLESHRIRALSTNSRNRVRRFCRMHWRLHARLRIP